MDQSEHNTRPPTDEVITAITDYVHSCRPGADVLRAAKLCLADSISCALLAHNYPACTRYLGPIVKGGEVSGGARVIGAHYALDPVKAAFDNGALIRWLDFNDTWLAAEWGHPSDNLGALWALGDYLSRQSQSGAPFVGDILAAMVMAHEIQGVLALGNSFNRAGLDHVILVKTASAALSTKLLGASKAQTAAALSNVFADGQALRTYRHAPNAMARKSWAAGDAASRGVRLAMMAAGEEALALMPSALSAKKWGFIDTSFGGGELVLAQPFGDYVMRNILYKVSFPAEFHAQTAVECALKLHARVASRLDDIKSVHLDTQESAVRIISKTGALHNPADRDHCLQYMTAVGLIFGELTAAHYEDDIAADPRIDKLRAKMVVAENPQYSRDYLDSQKRSIANAVRVVFTNGDAEEEEVHYPLGHARRREESLPHLRAKFDNALAEVFDAPQVEKISAFFDADFDKFCQTPMRELAAMLARAK
ncbi:MAG: bifunctional 2-methylcitrate dehydratase/aconitate hydratase [Gammaproteobacteria bacterium]